MIVTIAAITDETALNQIGELLAMQSWVDGRETAGVTAKTVKDNSQANLQSEEGQKLNNILTPAITQNAVLLSAARPRRFSHFIVSKTTGGGRYGAHVDNALMGAGAGRMRSDVSFTLFLSPRESYEGGELVIHGASGEQEIAGEFGQLVLYPSTSIHEVRPVTSGERHVAIGWIESLIPDVAKREVLFDLDNTRATLRSAADADPAAMLTLDKSIANLLRMWAQI